MTKLIHHTEPLLKCPECGQALGVLLFLGITPDGYVCAHCHRYYDYIDGELKALAHVIGI